jgi:uncharacterized protein YceK
MLAIRVEDMGWHPRGAAAPQSRSASYLVCLRVLLVGAAASGCAGTISGYLSQHPGQVWPDSYYYAALCTDAELLSAADRKQDNAFLEAVRQGAILADVPGSIIADTVMLPILISESARESVWGADAGQSTAEQVLEQAAASGPPVPETAP